MSDKNNDQSKIKVNKKLFCSCYTLMTLDTSKKIRCSGIYKKSILIWDILGYLWYILV